MRERKKIDRFFQEKFKDFESSPPEKVWLAIEKRLIPESKKRRVIPLWWKLSGVAAVLIIGFAIYNYSGFSMKPIEDGSSIQVVEISEPSETGTADAPVSNESSGASGIDESIITTPDLKSTSPDKRGILSTSNPMVSSEKTSVKQPDSPQKDIPGLKRQEGENSFDSENQSALAHSQHKKSADKNDEPSKKGSDREPQLAQNKTEIKKPDNIIHNETDMAVIMEETKALEELLLEKEKKQKDVTDESKVSRWLVTSSVAPVYFNSIGNGSPIDAQFTNNPKSYETSMSVGVGVNYALSSKLSVRASVNRIDFGYNTNDITFAANMEGQVMNNLDPTAQGATVMVLSRSNTNAILLVENPIPGKNDGHLNQRLGYVELPMELSYRLVDKSFGINIIGGVSTFVLTDNQISLVTPDFTTTLGEANNLNPLSFSTNFGIGFQYRFLKSFQANFEPTFKYQFNTFSSSAGNFRPYFIGLYTGVSYRF